MGGAPLIYAPCDSSSLEPSSGLRKFLRMRLDQWLCDVRIFHSRTQAAEVIKAGRVTANGDCCKPAHLVRLGELIIVQFREGEKAWRVLGFPKSRVGAKRVPEFAEAVIYGVPAAHG